MNERGFTLLEILIAMAIGTVILFGVSGFYLSALRFNAEASSQTHLQRQGALVVDEMSRQIRPATALAITTCSGVANSLQVTNPTPGGGSQTLCFRKSGSQLLEDHAGGGSRDLLWGSLSPLTVNSFSATLVGSAVTISFQLADNQLNQLAFTTTLAKRN
jgi:prepilin-type N-terminal cleavage/methylation domain-containing protein